MRETPTVQVQENQQLEGSTTNNQQQEPEPVIQPKVWKTMHLCLDIRGALKSPNSRLRGGFLHNDGRTMTPDEVREALMDALAEGKRVLPVGDECEGFDYQTGCPGHAEVTP